MINIVLIEDNTLIREELKEYLESKNYGVDTADCVADFWKVFSPKKHDVILIDLGLPDGDGSDLVREIRMKKPGTGIIVVTGRSSIEEKVSGFQNGADYYLTKPAALPELDYTIRAMKRRLSIERITQKQWVLDDQSWELLSPQTMQGRAKIKLSAQDYSVLYTLITECGLPVSRRQLVDALGKDFMEYDQRRMDTQIRRLRKKVKEKLGVELPVKTVHSVGYIFTADAEIKSLGA